MQLDKFDKWFNKQELWLKAVLLLIPVVGWVVEFLVRLGVALRTKQPVHFVVLALFALVGWGWILNAADFVYLLLKGHLFLAE